MSLPQVLAGVGHCIAGIDTNNKLPIPPAQREWLTSELSM